MFNFVLLCSFFFGMGRSNQVDAITGVVGEIVESYTFSCNPERTYDYLPYILRLNV